MDVKPYRGSSVIFESEFITQFIDSESGPKILIIEGPDGVGKSTCLSKIKDASSLGKDVRVLRFPENHPNLVGEQSEGLPFRNMIMSPDVDKYPGATAFLFLADFVTSFEAHIQPYLNDPNVVFLLDRFLPSTAIYQRLDLHWINQIFKIPNFKAFWDCFSEAHYVYLQAPSFDVLKTRLEQKRGGERNRLDPVDDVAIQKQIFDYNAFVHTHIHLGIFGSRLVERWER